MNTTKTTLTLLFSIFFISCIQQDSAYFLKHALKQAENNRKELEKVLNRYNKTPEDSLKYKAACFLIENMSSHYFFEGKLLDQYTSFYTILRNTEGSSNPAQIADSIRNLYPPFNIRNLQIKYDIKTIDSAFICKNIDHAFKVWKEQPWGKSVSFNTFLQYILPYRIDNEKLTEWREVYYNKFNHLLDSLRSSNSQDKGNPVAAAKVLTKYLQDSTHTYFTTYAPASLPHIGALAALQQCGSCREISDFLVYLYRSLGIPCAVDNMPIRANDNVGHSWVVLWDSQGKEYCQEYMDDIQPIEENGNRIASTKTKVYRKTFSLNRQMEKSMTELEKEIHPFFKHPHFIDVTYQYAPNYKQYFFIPDSLLYPNHPTSGIAYLCNAVQLSWSPVAWGQVDDQGIIFQSIECGGLVRAATWIKGQQIFLTDPFMINSDGTLDIFNKHEKKCTINLYAKYNTQDEPFGALMIGGVFQGSNDIHFNKSDTLYIIKEAPVRLNTVVKVHTSRKYQYVRYFGPQNSYCNIAEAVFFGKSASIPLKGKIIGTPGCKENDGSHEYTNVFDGKSWTSFNYKNSSGGWAGLDLEEPKQITHISYTPRNRDNYIRPGDVYELLYCDKNWISAGLQTATSDSLTYNNIPQNTLLILKNHTRGQQIRPFVYKEGKQIWL